MTAGGSTFSGGIALSRVRRVGAAVVIAAALAACGPSAQQRALRGTLTAVDAARDAFLAWDASEQQQIIAAATSLEAGQAKLTAHRAKRDRLVASFEATYRLLALAAADPQDNKVTLAVAAASALWAAYTAEVGVPPVMTPPKAVR